MRLSSHIDDEIRRVNGMHYYGGERGRQGLFSSWLNLPDSNTDDRIGRKHIEKHRPSRC